MSRSLLRLAIAPVAAVAAMLALGSCGSLQANQGSVLDRTLYEFSSDIRWSDFEAAYAFVDPATKAVHPLSDLDRERYKQVEVSGYEVVSKVDGPGTVDQQIRLDLINRNTQIPRSVSYREHWRWDPATKTWLLTTGLPDITSGQ